VFSFHFHFLFPSQKKTKKKDKRKLYNLSALLYSIKKINKRKRKERKKVWEIVDDVCSTDFVAVIPGVIVISKMLNAVARLQTTVVVYGMHVVCLLHQNAVDADV
jgi:hypothetical protein